MATLLSNPWAGRPEHHDSYARSPPSPPTISTSRCSLPSISNLLGLADAGSPTYEQPPTARQPSPFSRPSGFKPESRPSTAYSRAQPYQSRELPPSPPMSSAASVDNNSPSARNSGHFSAAPSPAPRYYETTPPAEAEALRQHVAPHTQPSRTPLVTSPSTSHLPPNSSYFAQASPQQSSQGSGIGQQRPLPQTFPPANVPMAAPGPASSAIAWQHHHYLNPSPGHPYAQSQDRYICPTCNKAFSRPSSLRIHSHSHTGEKPFKCSQPGCGKAFSVRSNMKRHERGCHAVEVNTSIH